MDSKNIFFFFNDTATTEIYTLSLHDALPIFGRNQHFAGAAVQRDQVAGPGDLARLTGSHHARHLQGARGGSRDRKSTRLNSSHSQISYAVFCLKKKEERRTFSDARHTSPKEW